MHDRRDRTSRHNTEGAQEEMDGWVSDIKGETGIKGERCSAALGGRKRSLEEWKNKDSTRGRRGDGDVVVTELALTSESSRQTMIGERFLVRT